MTESIIERAAKAAMGDAWIMMGKAEKGICRKQVRCILAAMREPTPTMIEAGARAIDWRHDTTWPQDIWCAMIDAALKESA